MEKGRRSVQNHAKGGRSIAEELPEVIVADIISRLPVKTIFSCRCVCKSWRNLLLDSHFAQLHFSRAPVEFLLTPRRQNTLYLAELDEVSCISNCDVDFRIGRKSVIDFKTYNKINCRSSKIKIYSSCLGLLCLTIRNEGIELCNNTWDPYHIYNPITGEHLVIPQMGKDSFWPNACELGLGKKNRELKVLRFLSHTCTGRLESDIQTLGTNLWRSIGGTPRGLGLSLLHSGPFLNGCLHWTSSTDELIISFDFEEEKFQSLPAPFDISGKDQKVISIEMSLGSLGGCLYMCYQHRSPSLEIWVMNEYGVRESWTKLFFIDKVIRAATYNPVRYMNNGEILVSCNGFIISHNPRKRSTRYIKIYGSTRAIPYVPSFMRVLRQRES